MIISVSFSSWYRRLRHRILFDLKLPILYLKCILGVYFYRLEILSLSLSATFLVSDIN